jgi:DNA topoisomerase-1
VQTGLSAGRVQSVAVRLIVDRRERLAFRAAAYWDLNAHLSGDGREFSATLARLGSTRVATGKDFDATGALTGNNVRLLPEDQAGTLVEG